MSARRQRGVALLAAVLVVALATVLIAAMLDRSEATQARARNSLRAEQGWQLMQGLEGWATSALRQDLEQNAIDSNEDVWAQDLPPIELPGVRINGRLHELAGCFNLNNLFLAGSESTVWMARFRRLLTALKLDESIADQALDWVDPDATPGSRGAEDMRMLLARPPHRAANRAFTHVSELRLLPGVTDTVYRVLAPQVCAVPLPTNGEQTGTVVNLNTASREFWMSLHEGITPGMAEQLWRDGHAAYQTTQQIGEEFTRLSVPMPVGELDPLQLGTTSSWFVLEAEIISDGIPFLYSSMLHRTPTGTFVTARWRGRY